MELKIVVVLSVIAQLGAAVLALVVFTAERRR